MQRVEQRLVTIYLFAAMNEVAFNVTDHLQGEIAGGWTIHSMTGIGAGVGATGANEPKGWLAVVLERMTTAPPQNR